MGYDVRGVELGLLCTDRFCVTAVMIVEDRLAGLMGCRHLVGSFIKMRGRRRVGMGRLGVLGSGWDGVFDQPNASDPSEECGILTTNICMHALARSFT